eukprot:TRINITY_DN1357_c0_g1_i1.p1 TRINITY_DN1357_c0_g1~~TRINITY_DN1357_c0_g1_i1.p1  ORF type:complete len:690 (-),score=109.19 TRINITY_DN1357_c0_g1_i1:297-2366(-)
MQFRGVTPPKPPIPPRCAPQSPPSLLEVSALRVLGLLHTAPNSLSSLPQLSSALPPELLERLLSLAARNGLLSAPFLHSLLAAPSPISLVDLGGYLKPEPLAPLALGGRLFRNFPKAVTFLVPFTSIPSQLFLTFPLSEHLRTIDLRCVKGLDDVGLRAVLDRSPQLRSLDVSGTSITSDAFPAVRDQNPSTHDDDVLPQPAANHPLDAGKRHRPVPPSSPLDERPAKRRKAAVSCSFARRLERLVVSGCAVSDRALSRIAEAFPSLTEFDCSYCSKISDISLLVSRVPIQKLTLDGCTLSSQFEVPFSKFAHNELQRIFYCGTGLVSTSLIRFLNRSVATLREIRLRNKIWDCDDLSGDEKYEWLRKSPYLEAVDLFDVQVGSRFLDNFEHSTCRTTVLRHLNVAKTGRELTLSHFLSLEFPHLESLVLPLPPVEERKALLSLRAPRLTDLSVQLSVDNEGYMSEQEARALVRKLPQLTKLELWCLGAISVDAVDSIVVALPEVKEVLLATMDPLSASSLTLEEFSGLERRHADVSITVWHHSLVPTRRSFRSSLGTTLPLPEHISRFEIDLEITHHDDGETSLEPSVIVDGIPLWTNEAFASLSHLAQTADTPGGALPLISQWCCECDIHTYMGVLFRQLKVESPLPSTPPRSLISWDIMEPGPCRKLFFDKDQYVNEINKFRHFMI